MIPIHELINRIRWDEALAKGNFIIGYYDRKNKNYPGAVSADPPHPGRSFFLSGHISGWFAS